MISKYFTAHNLLNMWVFLFMVMLVTSPDHGGAVGLLLLVTAGVLIYKQKLFTVDSETKWLIGLVTLLFLCFLGGAIWQPDGLENTRYGRNMDNPLRWVLLFPLL